MQDFTREKRFKTTNTTVETRDPTKIWGFLEAEHSNDLIICLVYAQSDRVC